MWILAVLLSLEVTKPLASSKVFGLWGSERLGLVEQGVGRAQCGWKISGRLLAVEVVDMESRCVCW